MSGRLPIAPIALCAGLGAVAAAAWWVGSSAQSPEQAAAEASEPSASWVTASVELRVLAATVVQRGDVRSSASSSVTVPSSVEGDPVVTQLLLATGDVVQDGDRAVEVSGRPVFVLQGEVPVYRTLRPTMSGNDVEQLQDALRRLGYVPDDNGVFGELTKSAVVAFYADAGYEPIAASPTGNEDIAAATQAVEDAEAAVLTAEAALDNAGESSPASVIAQAEATRNAAQRAVDAAMSAQTNDVALAQAQLDAANRERDRVLADPSSTPSDKDTAVLAAEQAKVNLDAVIWSSQDAVDSAKESLRVAVLSLDEAREGGDNSETQRAYDQAVAAQARAQATLMLAVAANGPTVPQGEMVFVPSLPARVTRAVSALGPLSVSASPDSSGASTSSLIDLASGDLIVFTSVRPSDVGLVRVGMDVELLDEVSGVAYPASIMDLADEAAVGADGQMAYAATVAPDAPLPDELTGANLRVTITSASTDGEALVVPLAAVSSAANGSTRVSVVDDPNGTPVDVPVKAGLSADGFVVVEPVQTDALKPGDLVVVGR